MSDCRAILSLLFCQIEHHDVLQESINFFVVVSNLPRKRLKERLERNLDIHIWFISGEKQF